MTSVESPSQLSTQSNNGKLSRFRRSLLSKDGDNASLDLTSPISTTSPADSQTSSLDATNDLSALSRASSEDRRSARLSKLILDRLKRRKSSNTGEQPDSKASNSAEYDNNVNYTASANGRPDPIRYDSRRSSLITDGSDDENRPAERPALSTHNSHIGLLTVTSPLIRIDDSEISTTRDTSQAQPPALTGSKDTLSDTHLPEPDIRVTTPTPTSVTDQKSTNISTANAHITEESADSHDAIGRDQAPREQNPTPDLLRNLINPSQVKRRTSELPALDTRGPPSTPPSPFWAPATVVTPPTPTSVDRAASPTKSINSVNDGVRHTGYSAKAPTRHRKSASVGSSKLVTATSAEPLTPTLEDSQSTEHNSTSAQPSTGFLAGFITAAQTAANHFGTSINTIGQSPRQRQLSTARGPTPEHVYTETMAAPPAANDIVATTTGPNEPQQVDHLGIQQQARPRSMTSPSDLGLAVQSNAGDLAAEVPVHSRAASVAYEKPGPTVTRLPTARPASIASQGSLPADQSPSRASTNLVEPVELKRSGSVRSKLSSRRNRHRGSSVGTSGTVAAASIISKSQATPTYRQTGFAVAGSKRNKDFHQNFRSVPEDDYLIEDYSAALQRDILLHGRFYVSEGHICFISNILGWVTNLVIAFDEIVSIEKKNTALVFPNALTITTNTSRNTWASFVARDATYDLLVGIWKTTQSHLKTSVHGVVTDGTGDKAEKDDDVPAESDSADASDDIYDEDAEDFEDDGSLADGAPPASINESEPGEHLISRKTSVAPLSSISQPNVPQSRAVEGLENTQTTSGAGVSALGPAIHPSSECADQSTHYDKQLVDTVIAAPLGQVYNIWFGPGSGQFMRKWLSDDQKCREVSYEDDKTGLDDTHKTFTFSYIKPLNAPVGPRQTKCIVQCNVLAYDLEKAISIDCSTQTPDVPSGSIFTVKTRYCLMWGPDNGTRVIASCAIEWTGKSWLKGPIENGANAGQLQYIKDIVGTIKAAVTVQRPVAKSTIRKGKTRRRKDTADTTGQDTDLAGPVPNVPTLSDWGIFEPVHRVLQPVTSILSPFMTSQVVIVILAVLLIQSSLSKSKAFSAHSHVKDGRGTVVDYDAMWHAEENNLWDWLDSRVVMDPIARNLPGARSPGSDEARQKLLQARQVKSKIVKRDLDDRQIENAIQVTEERLRVLKEAVQQRHEPSSTK